MSKFQLAHTKIMRLVAAGLVVMSLVAPAWAGAATEPRDANANAIMYNGAYSKTEWQTKLHNGDSVNTSANLQQIYFDEGRGITEANFMSSDTVDGTVFKDGHVEVKGKTVATDMYSVGRHNFPGRTPSGSVYESANQDAFLSNSLPAFVNMQGGSFHYVIIKSCGNPGRATPTPPPTPTPTPTPKPSVSPTPSPSPTPEQSFSCTKLMVSQPSKTTEPATYRFTVIAKVENLTLTGYRFGVAEQGSDSAADTRDIDPDKNFTEYTLGTGTWTVTGQVKTSAGITAISAPCTAQVTVSLAAAKPKPTPPPSTGEVLGVTLPATGPEGLLGGAIGLTALGYTARGYLRSRKSVLAALRGKDHPGNK